MFGAPTAHMPPPPVKIDDSCINCTEFPWKVARVVHCVAYVAPALALLPLSMGSIAGIVFSGIVVVAAAIPFVMIDNLLEKKITERLLDRSLASVLVIPNRQEGLL